MIANVFGVSRLSPYAEQIAGQKMKQFAREVDRQKPRHLTAGKCGVMAVRLRQPEISDQDMVDFLSKPRTKQEIMQFMGKKNPASAENRMGPLRKNYKIECKRTRGKKNATTWQVVGVRT